MLQKYVSLLITVVIFTHVYVLRFFSLMSAGPQKCSFVPYTMKHGLAYNTMLHSGHLNFILVSLFLVEHTWH